MHPARAAAGVKSDPKVLYEIVSVLDNSKLPRDIDDLHERLLENLRIKEQ
jgi:hypothetical protein